jgi:hypothetical protein
MEGFNGKFRLKDIALFNISTVKISVTILISLNNKLNGQAAHGKETKKQ